MAKLIDNKNQGGRPKSYSPELVHAIFAKSIHDGMAIADINAGFVKEQMCENHNVSDQIRMEGLKNLVDQMRKEFAEEERQTLLKGLPDGVAPAVEHAVAAAGQELLLLVARQNAACKAASDRECEELRTDKRNAFWRLAEIEAALQEQEGANRKLARKCDKATAQLSDAHEQLRAAQAEVERLKQDTGTLDRLLNELRNPAVRDDIRAVLAEIVATPGSEPRAS